MPSTAIQLLMEQAVQGSLGDAASLDIGTTAGTVAEGDKPVAAANAAVATHEAAADPHSTYLTAAEGDAAYQPIHATGASAIYYVDGVSGNDSNNGTSSGTAFATIAKAVDVIQGMRLVSDFRAVTVTVTTAATYVLPRAAADMIDVAWNVTVGSATRANEASYTIGSVAANADSSASYGVRLTVAESPGWSAGDLKGYMVEHVSKATQRPIAQAKSATSVLLGGTTTSFTVQPTVPADSGNWASTDAIKIFQPGVIFDIGSLPATGMRWTNVSFTGIQFGTSGQVTSAVTLNNAAVTFTNCVLMAAVNPRISSQVTARGCAIAASSGKMVISNNSTMIADGCVWGVGASGSNIELRNMGVLFLHHNSVLSNGFSILVGPGSKVMNWLPYANDRAALCLDDSKGIFSLNTATVYGAPGSGSQVGPGIVFFGILKSGETRYLTLYGGNHSLTGSDDVKTSLAATATVSVDGGATTSTVSLSLQGFIQGHGSFSSDLSTATGLLGMLQYETVSYAWPAAASDTISQPVLYPFDNAQVDAIVVSPVGVKGAGTFSVKTVPDGSGNNMLSAASYDLSGLSDNTGYSVPLTATTADIQGSSTAGFRVTITNGTVPHVVTVRFKRQAGL